MLIIETPVFTKRVLDALTDDEYRELQQFIAEHPEAGSIIPGSHGLRKLRWTMSGKGKRGGTRIIYYWLRPRDTILMLFVFRKNEQSDLTKDQLKILKAIVAKEFR
jgi:mRNA-degrading endonuclease RelE of RelBE toxin-antitoxin system